MNFIENILKAFGSENPPAPREVNRAERGRALSTKIGYKKRIKRKTRRNMVKQSRRINRKRNR